MSTVYYAFKRPITSVRLAAMDVNHTALSVHIKGQDSGHLKVRPEDVDDILDIFIDHDRPVATVEFAGAGKGMVLRTLLTDFTGYATDGRRLVTLASLKQMVQASQAEHEKLQLT